MVKKLRLKEDENNDMYYRLSYIDDTDKLIKDFNRRWEDFKNTIPKSFNAHVKNNAQELRDKVWDALNALIRATKATKLGEAVNESIKESSDLVGAEKAEKIVNDFKFSGDWFEDFHDLEDDLTDYYRNEVEIYNDNIKKKIKQKVLKTIIAKYPEAEEDIKDEFDW